LPVIIIGGIVFGVFTATEAAGIAVGYTAFLALVVYRNVTFSELIDCVFRSGVTTGVILLLVGASAPFAWLLTILEVPKIIAEGLSEVTTNKILVLILINIFLLVMGMLLDATANILILGPILMPVAIAFGIDPIHFSLIMIINLIIGLGTPPVGTVLFATVPIAKVSVEKISVAILPFCLAQLVILGFVTYVPALTMWIPTMLGYVY
jgi:tripartite ATP-independent transporter DctM subunit